jgi:hypothetical protein
MLTRTLVALSSYLLMAGKRYRLRPYGEIACGEAFIQRKYVNLTDPGQAEQM